METNFSVLKNIPKHIRQIAIKFSLFALLQNYIATKQRNPHLILLMIRQIISFNQ
jgi:hypothetical protein